MSPYNHPELPSNKGHLIYTDIKSHLDRMPREKLKKILESDLALDAGINLMFSEGRAL